jgi:hypothetical protein
MGRIVKRPIPIEDYGMRDRGTPGSHCAEIDPRAYLLASGLMPV